MERGPSGTDEEGDAVASARSELAQRLDALYTAAGSPPLKAVSARATREVRARNPRGREVSAQRISDWRLGRSVPAKFDGLSAVLGVLVAAARQREPEPALPGLYSMTGWHKLWSRAQTERAADRPAAPMVCPYPGLAALTIGDAEFFAGRDSQIDTMRERFDRNRGSGEPLILVGDSGVGKSSLLQAGFAARVQDEFDVLLVTPGAVGAADLETWAAERASEAKPYILAVDQLEELFLPPFDDGSADHYLGILTTLAVRGPAEPGRCAGVVAALRADFYTHAARHPALAALLEHNQMLLGPPTAEELTAAVVEPARRQNLRIGDGLVELILADLGVRGAGADPAIRAGTFPLLAHALRSTWQFRDGDVMSVRAYEQAGGVRGAIAASAEQLWQTFGPRDRATARTLLLHLVTPVADGTAVGRHADRETLIRGCPDRDSANAVLNAMAEARIITQDAYGTSLAHDAVLSAWPRLAEWIDEDREDAIVRHRLRTDADEWEAAGRDRALLYRGSRLAVARDLRSRMPNALSERGVEFLDAAELVRRRQRLALRGLALFLVVGAVVTSALAIVSMRQTHRAEAERSDAQFAALIAAAQHDQSADPTESAQLALVAEAQRPGDPQARGLLLASQSAPLAATVPAGQGAIYGVAQSHSGVVASGGYDNAVRLWRRDPAQGLIAFGPALPTSSWVSSVAFAPDGRTLFAATGSGVVHRWDVSDPARPVRAADIDLGHRGAVYSVAVRADGRWIATAGDDSTVRLHDLVSGTTTTLTGHTGPVRTVAFSPDGNTLASGSDDRTARVWDVTDPATAHPLGAPLTGQALAIHSVAFDPDGTTLATGSDDQTFRLWSTRDRNAVTALGPPVDAGAAAVWSLAFAPDGWTLVTAGRDGTAALWGLTDPRRPVPVSMPMNGSRGALAAAVFLDGEQVLTGGQAGSLQVWTLSPAVAAGHTGLVQAPSIDAAGTLMATGSWDGQVLLWDTTGATPRRIAAVLPLADDMRVENVALAPDGRTLAVTRSDTGDVLLFDTSTPAAPRPLTTLSVPDARYAHEIAFSPDSRLLATASGDTSVQLWDLADREHPAARPDPLTGPGGWVNAVAFAPDGSRLYAVSGEGRLHGWDLRANQRISTVLAVHRGALNALSISRDGSLIATGGDDQIVRVLRLRGDRAEEVSAVSGHTSTIRSVSFDPAADLLATGADDQTVRLWSMSDPAAPRAVGPSIVPRGTVRWRVQFGPTGMLAAGGENAVLSWMTTDTRAAAARACTATNGTELDDEWQRWNARLADACAR
ncbi:WD40 repeat domain-containing protein [Nocardia nova]|uniref:WD40 repeat domain-containing protein n=1 Tax=Nocardia nova TaxID=37330 RepID=UPI00046D33AA|nr:WD40 repeat domain-containing protein [Nocardia nova]